MTEYSNDTTISGEEVLWRRIPPWHVVFDKNLGRSRPKSSAFDNHTDGTPMSIFLASVVKQGKRDARDTLVNHEGFALAAVTAKLARDLDQCVCRDPLPDEPAHGLVAGKKTKRVKKTFAKEARWEIKPPTSIDR